MPQVTGWSLRRRLAVALMALVVVLVAVLAISVSLLVQVRSQQHQVVDRYFRAVALTNGRFIDQLNAETAVRGYALTKDPVTLQPLSTYAAPSYTNDVAELVTLVGRHPSVLQAFKGWDSASQIWYRTWAQPVVARVRAQPDRPTSTAEILRGKRLFDINRARYVAFSRDLVGKRNAATTHLQTLTTLLFIAVLAAVLSIGLAGAGLWWGLRRWVLAPLAELAEGTRLVRAGALDHTVAVSGPQELSALAGDVDEMRRDLVDQLAQVETARVAIEATGLVLEERAQELARSNRDLEQFAYVASHDLQEPLRKVASFCQMLEQRYKGQLDDRADQYIAFAVDGAKRMQQLINDLLAFSRVGRSAREFTEVDLNNCLDAALDNLSEAIDANSAEIVSEPLPTLPGDAALLTQLFQNLIGNSIKFHGSTDPTVQISAKQSDAFWEFGCADNGLGIEPQYADRIFVIFQRLHTKEEYAGTGIGLALCKRIVEHHGGRIWLDPDTRNGATFRWTLPTAQTRPSLAMSTSTPEDT
jgi:signal transduction histidine kinase